MARHRISDPARDDIAARIRYRALLTATMRRAAAEPQGPVTIDRADHAPGLRSLHTRHCRHESREAPVGDPVHTVFYRPLAPGLIEIARVLHDRMEPARHLGPGDVKDGR